MIRRIQIAAIIIITALFLIRIFTPPLTKHARAEKLYQDAWFMKLEYLAGYDDAAREKVSALFKQALSLSPDNSLYQQALVWNCPKSSLKLLIDQQPLDQKALIIAHHRLYAPDKGNPRITGKTPSGGSDSSHWRRELDNAKKIAAIDPENALVRYRIAYVYGKMVRQSDMLAEVRKANSMKLVAIRVPEVSPVIRHTMVDPTIGPFFEDSDKYRELARQMVGYSNELLRKGDIPAALDVSEEVCRMGIRLTSMQPYSYINNMVAQAVYAIGYRKLDIICRDFGMTGRLIGYRSINDLFNKNSENTKANLSRSMEMMTTPFKAIQLCMSALTVSFVSMMLFLLFWGITAIIRKAKGKEGFAINAWDEGWILRLLLPVYLLIIILGSAQFKGHDTMTYSFAMIIIVNLILAGVVIARLRKSYTSSQPDQVGSMRFIFAMPIAVRTWICRSLALFFAAQLVFVLCLGMLASQFTITRYRVLPWQILRMHLFRSDIEYSTAKGYADAINRLAIEKEIIDD